MLAITNFSYSQINIYVSTTGNDSSVNGSISAPFRTIGKAKDYVRTINSSMTVDIIVNILPGEYILNNTLNFNDMDSGKNGNKVIYQASNILNKPIISGGEKINGNWNGPDQNGIYNINIGTLFSRQVYVNGVKAKRAQSEDNFCLLETVDGYVSTKSGINFTTWQNITDLEVVANMRWRHHRFPVQSATCSNQIKINPYIWAFAHEANLGDFIRIPALRLENALELLDQNEEWYIKRNTTGGNILYYKPTNISNLNNVIIPNIEQLITGDNLNNVIFKSLDFRYSKWIKPSEDNNGQIDQNICGSYISGFLGKHGFWTNQADRIGNIFLYPVSNGNIQAGQCPDQINCSISFTYSSFIDFKSCSFSNIGSTALGFLIGSHDNTICTNTFNDIAASGICVGDYLNAPNPCLNVGLNPVLPCSNYDNLLVQRNIISNNTISNIANEYTSSCAILVSFARETTIKNNTLSNFPYTGISLGWGFSRHIEHGVNVIQNNYIDCSNQIMPDGAGIYTLCNLSNNHNGTDDDNLSPRSSIDHNYILNQKFYRGAIYLDNSSSNVNVFQNIIDTNFISFPSNHECVTENVKAIECWYNSNNVSITNNYYNALYFTPQLTGNQVNMIVCNFNGAPLNCNNVQFTSNTSFLTFGEHNQNSIITQSGVQQSENCN